MLRLLRLISYPQLRSSWGRTLLVVGGIAVGVTLMVAINITNTSVLESFRHSIEQIAGPADLEVTFGLGEISFDEALLETVRADPEVATAVPLVRGTLTLADQATDEPLQLFGADLTAEDDVQRYHVEITTSRREASMAILDPRSLFLTTTLAKHYGLDVGDAVAVSTPQGVERLTIRGLLSPDGLAGTYGGRLAVMDIAAAQWLLAKEGRLDQIDVMLRPGADRNAVRERLARALPSSIGVEHPAQRSRQYEGVLAAVQAMHTGISTLCLIAGTYLVYNTTSTGAVQRANVMVGLRLLGAEGAQLLRLLVLESLILGVVGTGLGALLGIAMSTIMIRRIPHGLGIIFQLRFPVETIAVDWLQILLIGCVGIAACVLASYVIARRLATLDPLEVSRNGVQLERMGNLNARRMAAYTVVVFVLSCAAFAAEIHYKSFAWGNVGSSLWNASAILVAVPFVSFVGSILARRIRRAFPAEGPIVADSLLRAPTRTGVTVAAIALLLGASITLASLLTSFCQSIDDYLGVALAGDLTVSAIATEGGWLETPLAESLAIDLGTVPGVARVETVRVAPGQLFRGQRISVLALSDGLFDPARLPAGWYHEGDPQEAAPRLRDGSAATISTSMAERFDLGAGDTIELETPTGTLQLAIAGVQPDYTSDRGTVMLDRALFAERWRDSTVSRFVLTLAPDADLETVRTAIRARFADEYRLKVQSLREAVGYIQARITEAFAFTRAIQLLIAIVAMAGVLDLLLSAIAERRREFALWRIIGADDTTIRRSLAIESATIGAMGTSLGLVFGIATSWIWVRINYRYLLGFFLEFHPALWSIVLSAVVIVVMTLLAGYSAGRYATREALLDGVRMD